MTRKLSAIVVIALMASTSAMAEVKPIRFKNGTLDLPQRTTQEIQAALGARSNHAHIILQFEAPVTDADRAKLETAGINLLDYLGDNGYFAVVSSDHFNPAPLADVPTLTRIGQIEMAHKLHPQLLQNHVFDWMVVSAPKNTSKDGQQPQYDPANQRDLIVAVYVKLHGDVDLDREGTQLMRTHDAAVRGYLHSVNAMVIELPYPEIKRLVAEDQISWIEPPLPAMEPNNNSNRAITGADIVQAPPYSLNGAGVEVMVYDGGRVDIAHADFQGRAVVGVGELACTTVIAHSTHVAGTIGGGGITNPLYKGMAPGVGIVSYGLNQAGGCSLSPGFLYTDPCDIQSDYHEAINTYGAVVANNSIGTNTAPNGYDCNWEGDYGLCDQVIDAIVRGSASNSGAPFRICWANGNERGSGRCGTTYHTTAPPACAKNHITCGALNSNDDSVASFTSWGPADDGRMKPDVSGPGCQNGGDNGVTSCNAGGGYTVFCGTSMATPTITGLVALLLQDYRVQFPGHPDPRNSTVKILLAQTAVDLFNIGPDFQTGYGSVRIQPAIDFMRSGNFLENQVSQGGVFNALCLVGPGQTTAKIMLAWDDPPGPLNTNPELVNDLDLVVFDPGNVQRFPWTLGGIANPSAPAVRTQKNAIDNIEQVFIDNATPGVYRIEVRGFNVPQGPQVFSLCASPQLINCSHAGSIGLDRQKYPCSATATLTVNDCDLNTNDNTIQTVNVTIASTSEPGGETVTLTESGPATALFQGTIGLSTTNSPGVLQVANGDTVTATYIDADDGQGHFNVTVTSTATVDCVPPVISNVQVPTITANGATITFNTNESAKGTVRWGTSCGSLSNTVAESGFATNHSVSLSGLSPTTTYYFAVDAVDTAGNTATDNNGGSCYTFSTPTIPEPFTEQLTTSNFGPLQNTSCLFTPNNSVSKYAACSTNGVASLPTDPTGGTTVSTWTTCNATVGDDCYFTLPVSGGNTVKLYGTSYSTVYIGSNGYVSLSAGDTQYIDTLANHFTLPRVAALFDDLATGQASVGAGTVSYKQTADRVAATWQGIQHYNSPGNTNTFQIEMFFDGRIRITWLTLHVTDTAIAGLSQGLGVPPSYFDSDLAHQTGGCVPVASNSSVNANMGELLNINLVASGGSGTLAYTVTSLASHGTLSDPNGGNIVTAPYTLLSNGNAVRYQSVCGYTGPDSFQFKATASGQDSNIATVSITVGPPSSPCTCVPKGDVDLNGTINGLDILAFCRVYMNTGGATAQELCAADCHIDGVVNQRDIPDFANIVLNQP